MGFCGLIFIFGVWRFMISAPETNSNQLQFYNDQPEATVFEGIVVAEPDIREDRIKLTVLAEKIYLDKDHTIKAKGKILVTVPRFPKYNYGDKLKITCLIKTPAEFDDFSYKNYLAKSDIYSVCYHPKIERLSSNHGSTFLGALLFVKDKFKDTIGQILPEPHASFLSGMLLGIKKGIPQNLKDAFNFTGTSHIIVISGLHITIIAGLLMYFAQGVLFLPRRYAFWFAVLGLLFFIALTGARPSAIRAGIMGGLVLLAMYSGRLSDVKNAILFAACIMLLINPKVLRFDIGFQLSFLATIGIVYLSPYFENILKFIPKIAKFRDAAMMTLSAQILTAPVILYNFERLSLIAPVANILILPLIQVTMVLGFFAGFLGIFWLILGKIVACIVWLLLSYEIFVVEWLAKIPYASLEIKKIWPGWILVYYIGIAILFWYLQKRETKDLLKR